MTHGDVVDALHEHSRATVIVTVPAPPAVPNDPAEFDTPIWQRVSVGVVMLGAMLVLWRNLKEMLFGVPVED